MKKKLKFLLYNRTIKKGMSSTSTVANVTTTTGASGTAHTCGDCSHSETSQTHFTCPVPSCGTELAMRAAVITDHIRKNHPKISRGMNLVGGRTAIYCRDCDRYTTFLHYHCYECENAPDSSAIKFFRSKEERVDHLKADHFKWWLEHKCRYGKACHGCKSGACGFNHTEYPERFIAKGAELPASICRYDCPWDGVRCNRARCSFDHFWGRVRALIKKQERRAAAHGGAGAGAGGSESAAASGGGGSESAAASGGGGSESAAASGGGGSESAAASGGGGSESAAAAASGGGGSA